jgi:succinoglycan biosynthesis protein ExoM
VVGFPVAPRREISVPDVSVIIPTFRRPSLLRAAVESVLSQRLLTATYEVVVVDNDPERSAEKAISSLTRSAPVVVRYVGEPRAGISHARNAGVTAAEGQYIAFLDDDEVAGPEWLSKLISTMRRCQADIVVGPVRPLFPRGVAIPKYAQKIYDSDARVPTGEPVKWASIGNALLLRDRCLAAAEPFDPKLGLSGGEDAVLFGLLRELGRRCVWCAEAAVTETIPLEKLRPAYLLRRALRGGQTTAYVPSALMHPQWLFVLRWMVIGATQVCLFGPLGIMLRLAGREEWLSAMAKAASGLGKVFWPRALHVRNYQINLSLKTASAYHVAKSRPVAAAGSQLDGPGSDR